MPEHIRISVSDKRGTSYYLINRLTKRYFVSFLALLLLFPICGGLTIWHLHQQNNHAAFQVSQLNNQVDKLNDKATELSLSLDQESASKHQLSLQLEEKDAELNTRLEEKEAELNSLLEEKEAELNFLAQRVDGVESFLGLQPEEESSDATNLEARIDSAAISTAVRATLFRLIPNGRPVLDVRFSSGFGTRIHPVTGKKKRHLGLDFAANTGTPIYAPADGVMEDVRPSNKGSGNFLKINHALGFVTTYSHLKKFNVKRGQFVKKGDLIGWSGNTGLSTGPHLHYEIRFLGRALNPRSFVDWTPDKFDSLFEKEKTVKWAALVEVISNVVALQVQLTRQPQASSIQTASNPSHDYES